jgi:hypothetical protein
METPASAVADVEPADRRMAIAIRVKVPNQIISRCVSFDASGGKCCSTSLIASISAGRRKYTRTW